ncbi:unnamed protein product [Periconia digitata]|uniref:AA1-like domain-containing protein n=1 Tax=Periconia digitata TaxID=1303443 RepID=A0A9W4XLS2_9PLEO|nr:unnamed protein product [Periconia digitata]
MLFTAFTTLLAATAAVSASPLTRRTNTEVVWTNTAGIVRNGDDVASISFTLHSDTSGNSTYCTTGANANPSMDDPKFYSCEAEEYAFRYVERVAYGRFKIALVHQTSAFAGLQGNMTIGCNGSNSIACDQVGKATATLCSDDSCGQSAGN